MCKYSSLQSSMQWLFFFQTSTKQLIFFMSLHCLCFCILSIVSLHRAVLLQFEVQYTMWLSYFGYSSSVMVAPDHSIQFICIGLKGHAMKIHPSCSRSFAQFEKLNIICLNKKVCVCWSDHQWCSGLFKWPLCSMRFIALLIIIVTLRHFAMRCWFIDCCFKFNTAAPFLKYLRCWSILFCRLLSVNDLKKCIVHLLPRPVQHTKYHIIQHFKYFQCFSAPVFLSLH